MTLQISQNPSHGQAKDLMIDILPNNLGFIDIHIDDSIGLVSAIDDNPLHINRAIQLAIKAFTHLLVPNGPFPRMDITSLKKLKDEG
jgi:hypothetical protein